VTASRARRSKIFVTSGKGWGYLMSERRFIYLEVYRPAGLETFPLEERTTIGKGGECHVVVDSDPTVSRLHASLEPYSGSWCIRDLGSRNGTFVNGDRIWSERVLQERDEIRVGTMRIVFRAPGMESLTRTSAPVPPPDLTRREKEVLVALCRPMWKGDYFTEPASIRGIAQELVVTDAAVKQHLSRLYDKFGVYEGEGERRIRLANEALRRGAVTIADLRKEPRPTAGEDEGDE
jgi:pSer/pThr/pTyr-binding forkhead associated (FHA) protein